jgi:hypothetical protein
MLNLTLARGYFKKLLENAKVVRFLNGNYRQPSPRLRRGEGMKVEVRSQNKKAKIVKSENRPLSDAGAGLFQETAGKRETGEVFERKLPGFSDGI